MGTGIAARPPSVRQDEARQALPNEQGRKVPTEGKRVRVAMLLTEDPFPARSGAAVRARALARGLRRSGYDVSFEVVNAEQVGVRTEDGFRVTGTAPVVPWRNPIGLYEAWNQPAGLTNLVREAPRPGNPQ